MRHASKALIPMVLLGVSCTPADEGVAAGSDVAGPPATPARQLLDRSIAFHDPSGLWGGRDLAMTWTGTGGDGEERVAVSLRLFADASRLELTGRYRGSTIEYRADGDEWSAAVDGETELSDEVADRMRLRREDGMFWRSYYGFLAGLPMKLRDPGTHIAPDVIDAAFQGRPVQAIRVTYDPEVGGDTWYFYFDPATAELVGCRFYHDESANDGEYIVFEGLVELDGLRLPRHRSWYVNADDRFLGADEVGRAETGS